MNILAFLEFSFQMFFFWNNNQVELRLKPYCIRIACQCNRESIIKTHSLFNLLILLDRGAQNIPIHRSYKWCLLQLALGIS